MRRMGLKNQIMTVALAIAVLLGSGAAASATVMTGDSNAYNVSLDLGLVNDLVNVSLQIPGTTTSGTAPAPYGIDPPPNDNSKSIVSADVGLNLLLVKLGLTTGVLNTHAESDVNGGPGTKVAEAKQSITDLGLGLSIPQLIGPPVTYNLIKAANGTNVITSEAKVSGDYNNFTTYGHSDILVADVIAFLGPLSFAQQTYLTAHTTTDGYALPNTELLDVNVLGLGTVTLKLNEQITGGDGLSSRSMTVNAIDLYIRLVGQLVDVDVIIGHSFAELKNATPNPPNPVPEPSTFMLIGGGLAGLAFWRRRQRK